MYKLTTMAALVAAVLIASLPSTTASAHCGKDHSKELRGDGTITLYRPVKSARATFKYRKKNGEYSEKAMEEIAHFLRCRLTDEEHEIDPNLIEILDSIEDHFGAKEIRVISAYRSPTRNQQMRNRNRRVARESYHTKGMALDIEVPKTSARALRDFAYFLGEGGVGYYRNRPFVHVDTGPIRTWGFKPRPTRSRKLSAMSNR